MDLMLDSWGGNAKKDSSASEGIDIMEFVKKRVKRYKVRCYILNKTKTYAPIR